MLTLIRVRANEHCDIARQNKCSRSHHTPLPDRYQRMLPKNETASGSCCAKFNGEDKCPTSFPAGITTSCSFNKTLFRAIGTVVGEEARVMSNAGIAGLTFWTPNVRASAVVTRDVYGCELSVDIA